jgi:hypothetical protein
MKSLKALMFVASLCAVTLATSREAHAQVAAYLDGTWTECDEDGGDPSYFTNGYDMKMTAIADLSIGETEFYITWGSTSAGTEYGGYFQDGGVGYGEYFLMFHFPGHDHYLTVEWMLMDNGVLELVLTPIDPRDETIKVYFKRG